jgi:hypothetical protein
MYLECIVADASQFNPNPAARSNVGRLEIRRRLLLDQRGLKTLRHRQPYCEVTILVMVVGKHREHTFVLLDEERRRAVRELFRGIRYEIASSAAGTAVRIAPRTRSSITRTSFGLEAMYSFTDLKAIVSGRLSQLRQR